MDILGHILRFLPHFRGKWRLQRIWESFLRADDRRVAMLPDGSSVRVQMDVPYERMVWLQAEEWYELRYLRRKLAAGDVFVDVGANIGLWTLVAASSVGAHGQVFSFEPNPKTYQRLLANVTDNGYSGIVRARQEAVSEDEGFANFSCEQHHNLSAIVGDGDRPNTICVRCTSLDAALPDDHVGGRIAGIKIDTEGHELATVRGAARLIDQHSPWLIVEFNTLLASSALLQDWPVYAWLCRRGYQANLYDTAGKEQRIEAPLWITGYRNILFTRAGRA